MLTRNPFPRSVIPRGMDYNNGQKIRHPLPHWIPRYVVEGVTKPYFDYEFTYPFLCIPGRLNHCSTKIPTSGCMSKISSLCNQTRREGRQVPLGRSACMLFYDHGGEIIFAWHFCRPLLHLPTTPKTSGNNSDRKVHMGKKPNNSKLRTYVHTSNVSLNHGSL